MSFHSYSNMLCGGVIHFHISESIKPSMCFVLEIYCFQTWAMTQWTWVIVFWRSPIAHMKWLLDIDALRNYLWTGSSDFFLWLCLHLLEADWLSYDQTQVYYWKITYCNFLIPPPNTGKKHLPHFVLHSYLVYSHTSTHYLRVYFSVTWWGEWMNSRWGNVK